MPMLADPSTKYIPYRDIPFAPGYVRRWPTKRTTTAPRWLSTDLRDGNQALVNPMSNATKLGLFRLLVQIGFKEIEVAYPSAAEPEFQFVRSLIENGEVPDDVSLQVITPARPDLITKSIASLSGCKHAIIHLYNAVSPVFREVVFRNTKEETIELTLNAVRLVKKLTEEETARSGTRFTLNYCLETFSQTEPEFAVELGNRVLEEWGKATPEDPLLFNLAATVECAPSNHYADMVEYFSNNIKQRDSVLISLHTHNDRGTAVAATELGLLAGGGRVEGCLLGNGERTGNVDLITLALNLYSQGTSPHLDFSNLSHIVDVVCRANEMAIPTRYPYAGNLVFSAFAGTHQDAIRKGLDHQERRWEAVDRTGEGIKSWAMPYIPLDPKDLGYGYENLIRVSSQSGKAGAAHIVKTLLQLDMPRRMQVAFYGIVQRICEDSGKEMTAALISDTFKNTYTLSSQPMEGRRFHLKSYQIFPLSPSTEEPASPLSEYSDDLSTFSPSSSSNGTGGSDGSLIALEGQLYVDGTLRSIRGEGPSPVLAILNALNTDLKLSFSIGEFSSQKLVVSGGQPTKVSVFLEMHPQDSVPSKSGVGSVWGVGVSSDITTAKCRAVISAVNGLVGERELPRDQRRKTNFVRPKPTPTANARSESFLREVTLRAGHGVHAAQSQEFLKLETSV